MCPDVMSACAPAYSGDPIIYAQEAARMTALPIAFVLMGLIICAALLAGVTTWHLLRNDDHSRR